MEAVVYQSPKNDIWNLFNPITCDSPCTGVMFLTLHIPFRNINYAQIFYSCNKQLFPKLLPSPKSDFLNHNYFFNSYASPGIKDSCIYISHNMIPHFLKPICKYSVLVTYTIIHPVV